MKSLCLYFEVFLFISGILNPLFAKSEDKNNTTLTKHELRLSYDFWNYLIDTRKVDSASNRFSLSGPRLSHGISQTSMTINSSDAFGVAKVGTWASAANYARFGHINYDGTSAYGFLQDPVGDLALKGTNKIDLESPLYGSTANFTGTLTASEFVGSWNGYQHQQADDLYYSIVFDASAGKLRYAPWESIKSKLGLGSAAYLNASQTSIVNTIVQRDGVGDISAREFAITNPAIHNSDMSAFAGIYSTSNQVTKFSAQAVKSFLGLGSAAYLDPSQSTLANTLVQRDGVGDISAREFVITSPTVHNSDMSAFAGIYSTSNQVTKFSANAVKSFLGLGSSAYENSFDYLKLAPNVYMPTHAYFAIGSSSGRNFIQSHASQPLDINPLGNAVTINGQSLGSNAFSSTAYLPVTGGSVTGPLAISGLGTFYDDLNVAGKGIFGGAIIPGADSNPAAYKIRTQNNYLVFNGGANGYSFQNQDGTEGGSVVMGALKGTSANFTSTVTSDAWLQSVTGIVHKNDVSTNNTFGIYFSNTGSQSYAIFKESGGWEHPYPDLRVAFHTGIKIGAQSIYGGTRFYNTETMSTEIMSIGNGDNNVRISYGLQAVSGTFSGNVGIGTDNLTEKLNVNGNIRARAVKVAVDGWPDYVFEPSYKLPNLGTTEQYIKENKHLPEVPSAKEVETNGIELGQMNALLLKKVEELTLHLIEQNKRIKSLETLITNPKLKP